MTKEIQNSNNKYQNNKFCHLCFVICHFFVICVLSFVILASNCFAEASVNIPLHHWSYDALDDLNRAGLIDGAGLTSRPISRMDAARLVQQAINNIQKEKVQLSVFDENKIYRAESALDSLISEFRQELIKIGVTTVAEDDQPAKDLRFRLGDPIYTDTVYADLKNAPTALKENQRGFRLKDGFNHRVRVASWVEVYDFLALEIEPAARFSKDTEDIEIETGYAKVGFKNIEIQAGRDTVWWGPGYHGSMLLSDNAYPLNLVKIGTAHPFRLPWGYEAVGRWDIDFFVARLEDKRDFPHARLGGLRIEYAPCDYFNLGVSRTAVFGGKGRPHLGASDYWDIFTAYGKRELSQDVNTNTSDQKASVDFKMNIPWGERPFKACSNVQVYGEWAGEDKFAPWENESPGYLGGVLVSDVLNYEDLDLRVEYANTNARWYEHGIYATGYRYKGEIMGHHMGPDAADFFTRLSKRFKAGQELFEYVVVAGQFDYEAHGRSLLNVERKYEPAIEVAFYLSDSKSVRLLYEYQAYRNLLNLSGNNSHNNIFEAEANVKF
jgi:hypothetical protein